MFHAIARASFILFTCAAYLHFLGRLFFLLLFLHSLIFSTTNRVFAAAAHQYAMPILLIKIPQCSLLLLFLSFSLLYKETTKAAQAAGRSPVDLPIQPGGA